MRTRGWRLDRAWLLLVALVLATSPSEAEILIGGGKPAADCYGTLDVRGAADLRRVTCVDGDPACDTDGQCQGSCTFDVAVCLNQPNVESCAPQPLRKPAKVTGGLPLPDDASGAPVCGARASVAVALKGKRANKPRTQKIRLVVVTTGKPARDADKFLLRCEPRDGACPTTTTSLQPGGTTTTSTLPNVTACTEADDCLGAVCSQGICCSQTCDGPCNECSAATGGICTPKGCGTPGVCRTGPGTCASGDGSCEYPAATDGTSCGDGRLCCAGGCCAAGEDCIDGACQVPCKPLADVCDDEGECCQDGATFCEGGSCCHALEESCASDAECCSGRCRDGESCCSPPNGPCTSEGDCCTGELGDCVLLTGGGRACRCRAVGESCGSSNECCGLATCTNGTCKAGGCVAPQGGCTSAFDCCWDGTTACIQEGGGGFTCCRGNAASCVTAGDCCGGAPCIGGACCRGDGQSCNANTLCCPGLACEDGTCQTTCPIGGFRCGGACCGPHQYCVDGTCQCIPLRGSCNPNANLCCRDEETLCPAQNPFGNANTCCRPLGGHCSAAADCCQELYDSRWNRDSCGDDGLCGGAGAYCGSDAECIGGLICVGACYGRGAGFKLCKSDPECPAGQQCSQRRCIHPNDLPD